jgi:hypothetical protein
MKTSSNDRPSIQIRTMRSSRNNLGVSHENGSVEAADGQWKAGLGEALELRGSRDFAGVAGYRSFMQEFHRAQERAAA